MVGAAIFFVFNRIVSFALNPYSPLSSPAPVPSMAEGPCIPLPR